MSRNIASMSRGQTMEMTLYIVYVVCSDLILNKATHFILN